NEDDRRDHHGRREREPDHAEERPEDRLRRERERRREAHLALRNEWRDGVSLDDVRAEEEDDRPQRGHRALGEREQDRGNRRRDPAEILDKGRDAGEDAEAERERDADDVEPDRADGADDRDRDRAAEKPSLERALELHDDLLVARASARRHEAEHYARVD